MKAEAGLYAEPQWYDLIHGHETESVLDELLAIAKEHGAADEAWLEPACGSGRFLEALARRGVACFGYDAEPRAVAYARRRLARFKGLARAARGRLESCRPPGRFAAAFCLDGSLRHLLTERDALRHLRLVAGALSPGGLYLVGLDLCDYEAAADDEESWEAQDGPRRAWLVQLCLAPDPRRRRERVLNFLTVEDGARRRSVESSYDLRSYDWPQWRSLLAASPFSLEAAYAPGKRPAAPEGAAGAFLFVLRNG